MRNIIKLLLLLIFIFIDSSIYSWEILDRVIAVVNNKPIVESEILNQFVRIQKLKKIPAKRLIYEKSRILDRYIEDAIFIQEADEQSIIVSDEKVNNHIEKMMKNLNVDSLEEFKKRVEAKEKIDFDDFREDLRKSLIKELVMSIAIGVSPPSSKEMEAWYNANKKKLGYEVSYKHIMIRPKNDSMKEEKRVYSEIEALLNQIKSGASFDEMARKYSDDAATKKNGGSVGWVYIAQQDPILAGSIDMMFREGKNLKVVKSTHAYHIVKLAGKRNVTFEAVKDLVHNHLFQQRLGEQFQKWVVQKKKESDIKIYMEDYVQI
jgi:putative peptidyl-prolyl cis-trans isomerase